MKKLWNKLFRRQRSFSVSNHLENLLVKLSTDPSKLPEFQSQMFFFKFFVFGKKTEQSVVQFLSDEINGQKCVFAFTSLEALESSGITAPPVIEMAAADLLPLIVQSGLGLILNPNLEVEKLFSPEDVSEILSGGNSLGRMPLGSTIRFSIPEKIPAALLSALVGHIQKTPGLEDIYFGLQEVNQQISYILALKIAPQSTVSVQTIVADLRSIIKETGSDRAVDMAVANQMVTQAFEKGHLLSCANFLDEFISS